MLCAQNQSVTSRLETSRYRDFSQFFESIGLGLENFGLKKSLGIGLENIWSQKKSRYRSRMKFLVSSLSDNNLKAVFKKGVKIRTGIATKTTSP